MILDLSILMLLMLHFNYVPVSQLLHLTTRFGLARKCMNLIFEHCQ